MVKSKRPLTLSQLIKKETVVIGGVYDCLSGLLAQRVGFKALYLSGGALSVSLLGKPDIGLLTLDEVVFMARRITSVVKTPLLVDVDTGFGGEDNVRRTVKELESVGVAGIQIEDQTFPKRCGHLSGKNLISPTEMALKIKAIRQARKDSDFLIIARTDARGVSGFKDALARAKIYKKAGADVIFPEALKSVAEFRYFGSQKKLGPLLANMTEFGISPALTSVELSELGYRLVLFPMTAFRAAAYAMEQTLDMLKIEGQSKPMLSRLQRRVDLYDLIGYKKATLKE